MIRDGIWNEYYIFIVLILFICSFSATQTVIVFVSLSLCVSVNVCDVEIFLFSSHQNLSGNHKNEKRIRNATITQLNWHTKLSFSLQLYFKSDLLVRGAGQLLGCGFFSSAASFCHVLMSVLIGHMRIKCFMRSFTH